MEFPDGTRAPSFWLEIGVLIGVSVAVAWGPNVFGPMMHGTCGVLSVEREVGALDTAGLDECPKFARSALTHDHDWH